MSARVALIVLLGAVVATGCGDFGDPDLETEVGNEQNNRVDPEAGPVDNFSSSVRVAVGARHQVTPTEGTRFVTVEVGNSEVLEIVEETRSERTFEVRCVSVGDVTVDITLESTSDSPDTASGVLDVSCARVEQIVLAPMGFSLFSRTSGGRIHDTIVTTQHDFSLRYDLFARDNRLAGYAYDPFIAAQGIDYTSLPARLGASSDFGRRVELRLDPDADTHVVDTRVGTSFPIELIEPSEAEDVVFVNMDGERVSSGEDDLAGEILLAQALWQSEPVIGAGFEFSSLTPDVCEVDSVGAVTEDEGDDTSPVFIATAVSNGTCEAKATIVDGSASGTLVFEVTGQ
ncbi:MAG: hypothetical protein ACQEVA_13140 [Myxococcota bacterium]